MPLRVAIVGAGPAGFYTAEALLGVIDDVEIDLIERLPSPYGLIRTGVAPDHQSTKQVTRRFEKTALNANVRYFGNVALGRDIQFDELRTIYDAIVLAVGAEDDRSLGVPGEDLRGVLGSACFVGWFNGHPDFRDLMPDLSASAAVVVGIGNVALDVARVLMKTPEELAASDLVDHAASAIRKSAIRDVYILGRRGPNEAKFTNVELREMGGLAQCVPQVSAEELPTCVNGADDRDRRMKEKNLATLKDFATRKPDEKPKRAHFRFYSAPVEIDGRDRVEGVRIERTRVDGGSTVGTGIYERIPCGLVIACIGYGSRCISGVPFDPARHRIRHEDGRVARGVYAVGWAKRGPTGVIASNRADAEQCALQIKSDIQNPGKPGRQALKGLLRDRGIRFISFDEWRRIDAEEIAGASAPAPRRKFVAVDQMLAVLDDRRCKRSAG